MARAHLPVTSWERLRMEVKLRPCVWKCWHCTLTFNWEFAWVQNSRLDIIISHNCKAFWTWLYGDLGQLHVGCLQCWNREVFHFRLTSLQKSEHWPVRAAQGVGSSIYFIHSPLVSPLSVWYPCSSCACCFPAQNSSWEGISPCAASAGMEGAHWWPGMKRGSWLSQSSV